MLMEQLDVKLLKKKITTNIFRLIKEFKKLSGHGIVINTSFNIQGEPVVCSPRDALRTFGGTGLDAMIIGDLCFKKIKLIYFLKTKTIHLFGDILTFSIILYL